MRIEAKCPTCEHSYLLPSFQEGKRVRCKNCADTFVVPSPQDDVPILEEADADDRRRRVSDELPVLEESYEPARRSRRDDRSRREDEEDDRRPAARPRPRRDDDEDEDEEDEAPASGGMGKVLVIVLVAGLLLVLVACGGVGIIFTAATPSNPPIAANQPLPPPDNLNPGPNNPPGDRDRVKDPPIVQPPPPVAEGPPKDLKTALEMVGDFRLPRKRMGLAFLNDTKNPVDPNKREEVERALVALQENVFLADDVSKALDRWGSPSGALDRLIKQASNNNPRIARTAMQKLSKIDDDKAAEAIAAQLSNPFRRSDAGRNLAQMGKRGEKAALPVYNHEDELTRRAARDALQRADNESLVKQCVRDLDAAKLNENDFQAERRIIVALQSVRTLKPTATKETNDAVGKHLESLLGNKNHQVRKAALSAMDGWVSKESVPALLALLTGKTSFVGSEEVIEALLKFKEDERVLPLLLALVNTKYRDTAQKAIVAFGPKAEDPILPALRSKKREERFLAIALLSDVGTNKSLPKLQDLARVETDKQNRQAIVEAVKKIKTREKAKEDAKKDKTEK